MKRPTDLIMKDGTISTQQYGSSHFAECCCILYYNHQKAKRKKNKEEDKQSEISLVKAS